MQAQTWAEFYKPRMNARYLQNLSVKYKPFLDLLCNVMHAGMIEQQLHDIEIGCAMVETGCGAGNISRLIIERNQRRGWFHLIDNSDDMLQLAKQNLQGKTGVRFYNHDIRSRLFANDYYIKCMFSHGVLEHFCEEDINKIIDSQLASCNTLIHYVPSAKYLPHKSFGDEHLWTPKEWKRICNPDNIIEFNDGHDLILCWGLNG